MSKYSRNRINREKKHKRYRTQTNAKPKYTRHKRRVKRGNRYSIRRRVSHANNFNPPIIVSAQDTQEGVIFDDENGSLHMSDLNGSLHLSDLNSPEIISSARTTVEEPNS